MKNIIILLLTACTWMLAPQTARADFFNGFELQAGVEFPVSIGGRGQFNFGNDIYMVGGLGYVPGFMTGMMETMTSGLGVVGESTGKLITKGLSESLYLDARGGYRFQGEQGLYIEAGISMFMNGRGEVDVETINKALGTFYIISNNRIDLDVASTNITFHAGYTWKMSEKMYVMVEGGIIKPLSATVSVQTNFNSGSTETMKSELKSYISDQVTGGFMIPTVAAHMSYLF